MSQVADYLLWYGKDISRVKYRQLEKLTRKEVVEQMNWDAMGELDEDLIEAYRGTVSLPFAAGEHRRIAVKIIDDRGIESLKIVEIA